MLTQALRETIRVQNRHIPLLERHLARLSAGGCSEEVLDAARARALAAANEWTEPYGRMTLLVDIDGSVSAEVTNRPSTIDVPGGPTAALVSSDVPVLPLGAAKPADRSFWDRALHEAQGIGADVAILVDPFGHLIDGSQASVWLVVNDTLVTPPSPPALAGVSRAFVLDLARELGIPAQERPIPASEFNDAAEAFFTTAVAGAIAVRDRGGPVSVRIAQAFSRAFTVE